MTKNTVIFIFLNMLYLLIWYATNKIRSTKVGKELDNGFEFYNSLNTSDKENYWKEDTKILNLFFVLFIISMDISVILLFFHNPVSSSSVSEIYSHCRQAPKIILLIPPYSAEEKHL